MLFTLGLKKHIVFVKRGENEFTHIHYQNLNIKDGFWRSKSSFAGGVSLGSLLWKPDPEDLPWVLSESRTRHVTYCFNSLYQSM